MLSRHKSNLIQRLDKMVKKESPPKEGESQEALHEDQVSSGKVTLKRADEIIQRKSVQHLFAESAAARELFDKQVARIKLLKPEISGGLDFKMFAGTE